ncbi:MULTISPECIES: YebC/PmpR family DNA-binding transcriptional regulator [unclassified Methylophaga]|jgi:YebC/PmpR family DNA-binding regulatory protein|uniref:YebC/PmpR family DNA-binding transcriptional regulator n=1 Tax=unclassified Methylophaga TaxID=2629249 RepID=UPI000C62E43F|nr:MULTISPECIES: YebC/PmpR family DNA-binding transcriptional regulator [unclassified Methylophaga]MAL49233.1 YebC/PmpR family DNA-binding transcriptional regulator [Methylophaga sp.]MAP27708.1 YebC/PmpR family DNA-binding transcriptional regulator [Methylophaga sp.]MBP25441.1 YebC/PmpR family DNA-binding transcriptional regulator [Methylophaga sp.]HBX61272.1 YebC/PmpR family DNA-binding transcriptional regulator [Methylophaga sp.]HCC82088.1 YebC/PmpR family DNA-binding transcriptional regulat|tara:strand:+ start:933 stop:1682 length:750 start_codon:yes stop_codon:yes gene_type:complete
MAGHSKWANIQHRKGAQDAKRGKLFTRLIREITVAARMGGSDPATNPRLRAAIDKALGSNMTKDVIERASKRGAGELEGAAYEEVRYEGYGPNGIAIMVDCMTDNRNRTVAEVRHVFSKRGGNMGTDGCVAFMFNQKGIISLAPGLDEDAVMEVALEAGAEDIVTNDDGSIDVFTTPDEYAAVKDALDAAGFEAQSAEVTMHPDNTVSLELDDAQKAIAMIEAFEELDDVQQVYSNADFSDEVMAQLEN